MRINLGPVGETSRSRFLRGRRDLLVSMQHPSAAFTVGLGPSHATRACERVPLAMPTDERWLLALGP